MRKIKFRAKCLLLNRWMYGSLVIKKTGKVYINSTEVDPETVGQYVNIDDIKDIEIYEGDILNIWLAENYQELVTVVWDPTTLRCMLRDQDHHCYGFDNTLRALVLDNIHSTGKKEVVKARPDWMRQPLRLGETTDQDQERLIALWNEVTALIDTEEANG